MKVSIKWKKTLLDTLKALMFKAVPIEKGETLSRKYTINQEIQQINVNELSRIVIDTLIKEGYWNEEEFDKDPVPEQTVVDKYTVILDYGNYDLDEIHGFEPFGTSDNAYGRYNLKVTVTGYRKAGLFE